MPDDRLGERICTFVAPLGNAVPTLESVTAYLEGAGVPKRLWPERIEIIDEIPKTLMGKGAPQRAHRRARLAWPRAASMIS